MLDKLFKGRCLQLMTKLHSIHFLCLLIFYNYLFCTCIYATCSENILEVLLLGLETSSDDKQSIDGGEDSAAAGRRDAVDETNVAYVAELFSSSVDALLNPVEAAAAGDLVSNSSSRLLFCLASSHMLCSDDLVGYTVHHKMTVQIRVDKSEVSAPHSQCHP